MANTTNDALRYMKHEPLCAIVGGYEQGCTCGRDAAAEALAQPQQSVPVAEACRHAKQEAFRELLELFSPNQRGYIASLLAHSCLITGIELTRKPGPIRSAKPLETFQYKADIAALPQEPTK